MAIVTRFEIGTSNIYVWKMLVATCKPDTIEVRPVYRFRDTQRTG